MCISPPALALHGCLSLFPFSRHPSLQPRSRATTFKVRTGAWLWDGSTLRLSLCRDLAPAPPARPSGSPGGAHSQGNLLPGFPAARTPPRGPSWGGPELPSLSPPPPRRVLLTVVPGRPPGARQHVGGLQGVVGGGRHPAALEAVPFDLLYQEGARHGATGGGLGGGTCVGPRWGEAASRARLAVCAGFQHWTAPSGRAGGSAEPAPVAAAPALARAPARAWRRRRADRRSLELCSALRLPALYGTQAGGDQVVP